MPAVSDDSFHRRNRLVYESSGIVDYYSDRLGPQGLLEGEKAILAHLGEELRDADVLDVGVGGGRTTPHLHGFGRSYVGIDYSSGMVERCRRRFPGVDFRHCDACDMKLFADASFDLVFFSYNGIDHVGLDSRLRILSEIHRVLRPGGVFVFSTHNLRYLSVNPLKLGLLVKRAKRSERMKRSEGLPRAVADIAVGLFNYARNKRREIYGEGYAVVVDRAHNFRLLMYYTTMEAQVGQLARLNFGDCEMVATDGSFVKLGDPVEDAWIYYVARHR